MAGEETVAALRSALQVSPDNLPLVLHLGDTLLSLGRGDEAEREFRAALNRWSDDAHLKVGLARAFEQQGKTSHAQVVLEEICGKPDAPARGLVLYARLLLRAGEVDKAVRTYKRGLAADPTAADETLAEQLGVRPAAPSADHDHDEEIIDGRERQRLGGEIGPAGEIERPKIAFSDVGGMETVKEEIRLKIIYPIQHADLYRSYGKAIGGGILLYGPPGCGKTHLARATAGEIKAGFMNIGINDVLDMWIGQSEKNLHALFDQARRSQPCVMSAAVNSAVRSAEFSVAAHGTRSRMRWRSSTVMMRDSPGTNDQPRSLSMRASAPPASSPRSKVSCEPSLLRQAADNAVKAASPWLCRMATMPCPCSKTKRTLSGTTNGCPSRSWSMVTPST